MKIDERYGTKSEQLARACSRGTGKIVTVTLLSFPALLDDIKRNPTEIKGTRFAIIVVEAHSSQSGDAATAVKSALRDLGPDSDWEDAGATTVNVTDILKAKAVERSQPPTFPSPSRPSSTPSAPSRAMSLKNAGYCGRQHLLQRLQHTSGVQHFIRPVNELRLRNPPLLLDRRDRLHHQSRCATRDHGEGRRAVAGSCTWQRGPCTDGAGTGGVREADGIPRRTPRGTRLARRLCAVSLDARGIPYGTNAHDAPTFIAADLCSSAAQHGHLPGRDFRLQLGVHDRTVHIEVADTRGEGLPTPAPDDPTGSRPNGRGLPLVAALADLWGWRPRPDGPGKTVWAQLTIPATAARVPSKTDARPLHSPLTGT